MLFIQSSSVFFFLSFLLLTLTSLFFSFCRLLSFILFFFFFFCLFFCFVLFFLFLLSGKKWQDKQNTGEKYHGDSGKSGKQRKSLIFVFSLLSFNTGCCLFVLSLIHLFLPVSSMYSFFFHFTYLLSLFGFFSGFFFSFLVFCFSVRFLCLLRVSFFPYFLTPVRSLPSSFHIYLHFLFFFFCFFPFVVSLIVPSFLSFVASVFQL